MTLAEIEALGEDHDVPAYEMGVLLPLLTEYGQTEETLTDDQFGLLSRFINYLAPTLLAREYNAAEEAATA